MAEQGGTDERSGKQGERNEPRSALALGPNWWVYLVAFALIVLGAYVAHRSAPLAGEDRLNWWWVSGSVAGLIFLGIGEAILIYKIIEERALNASTEAQKINVDKAVKDATGSIIANLDKTFSVVGDCRREHLLEVLPPRRMYPHLPTDSTKDPKHFDRLWNYFIHTLATKCSDKNAEVVKLRLCSIAETDMFHGKGRLTRKFSDLMTTGLIETAEGKSTWFCGCGSPDTCKRKLHIQVIILDPESEAAGFRTKAEGAANEVWSDIKKTITQSEDLAEEMRAKPLGSTDGNRVLEAKIVLELATVNHHPLTSFIHAPDWVQIELIHWGRRHDEFAQGYQCLGGRVPVFIFSDESHIHGFLRDQFDLQWTTPYSEDGGPNGLGWLGSTKIVSSE